MSQPSAQPPENPTHFSRPTHPLQLPRGLHPDPPRPGPPDATCLTGNNATFQCTCRRQVCDGKSRTFLEERAAFLPPDCCARVRAVERWRKDLSEPPRPCAWPTREDISLATS